MRIMILASCMMVACSAAPLETASAFHDSVALGSALADASGCFVNAHSSGTAVPVPDAAHSTKDGIAYSAAENAALCGGCSAPFGYRTYDGLPPAASCVAEATGSGDYCCTAAICVPGGISPGPCAPFPQAPYLYSCAPGATSPSGCLLAKQPDYPGFFCCPTP
jgi:hypothetical protein